MIFFCLHCEREFERKNRGAKFCSFTCRNQANVKIHRTQIAPYVLRGESMLAIARALGVEDHCVRRAIRRNGLYQQWKHARYPGAYA